MERERERVVDRERIASKSTAIEMTSPPYGTRRVRRSRRCLSISSKSQSLSSRSARISERLLALELFSRPEAVWDRTGRGSGYVERLQALIASKSTDSRRTTLDRSLPPPPIQSPPTSTAPEVPRGIISIANRSRRWKNSSSRRFTLITAISWTASRSSRVRSVSNTTGQSRTLSSGANSTENKGQQISSLFATSAANSRQEIRSDLPLHQRPLERESRCRTLCPNLLPRLLQSAVDGGNSRYANGEDWKALEHLRNRYANERGPTGVDLRYFYLLRMQGNRPKCRTAIQVYRGELFAQTKLNVADSS